MSTIKDHGMRRICFFDPIEVFGYDRIGLVPADRLKFPLAPLADTLKRRLNTVPAIDIVSIAGSFCT